MLFVPGLQAQLTDTLSWPAVSFVILLLAVLFTLLVLWRRYLSRRMLMQRVTELEALSAAGRALVESELDLYALCELIAQEASKVVDSRTFQVGIFDRQFYQILFWQINGRRQETPQTFDLSDNPGLIGWVRQAQTPLLVRDFERERDALPAQPRYVSDSPPRSAIFIPLISGEPTLGIIAAHSDEPHRFSEEDLRRLNILANQAAAAIANARLYEEARMRAVHLELVGQIARQVNAVQDLEEIFSQVVDLTWETFGFHPVNIFGIDPQNDDVVLQASSLPDMPQNGVRLALGQGLVGTAAATHEMIVCNNTAEDERFLAHLESLHFNPVPDIRAEIVIPLLVNNEVLGVLDVQSEQIGAFSETEQVVLEALAAEVASAIYKAQQLAWQQGQAWTTTAQLQVAEAISRSADLEETVDAVTRLTPMLVGVSFCAILLWDQEMEGYYGASLYGAGEKTAEKFRRVRLTIGDWGALDAVHVGQQPLTTEKVPSWLRRLARQVEAELSRVRLLPLITSGQAYVQGVMLVDDVEHTARFNDGSRPGQRRQELLVNVAQQTAQAVESARLRMAQQEEAWVNTALLQVAEAVNSLIDLNEILGTIVRLVPLLVGVESVVVLIWDAERELFVPGPSYGISTMGRGLLETLQIDQGEFRQMTAYSADARSPLATYYAIRLPGWLETVLESPTAYAFPLNAQGRLVGAMVVGAPHENGRSFSVRRINILNGIAQQAATAVVNNQLYRESADRARLQQELNVAHDIQASFLPSGSPDVPGCTIASLWQAARQVSGDFYDFLPRADGTWGIVIADVADKGVPAALFMALSRTILRTVGFNRKDPAQVLMRANEIVDREAQSDLFVTVFYSVWDPQTETLTYANGGHNPPLLLRDNGDINLLKTPGIALGVLPDVQIERHTLRLYPGDVLLFYTDGVTEAMNEDYDEFGMERLLLAVRNARSRTAPEILQAIIDSVRDHAGETPQFDDITMVVMKR